MKKTVIYMSAVVATLALGAGYFSTIATAKDGAKQEASIASTSVRYAADALSSQGAAVLCGDPMSTSSTTNLNRLLEEVGRYYNQAITIAPMETAAGICLFLSRAN